MNKETPSFSIKMICFSYFTAERSFWAPGDKERELKKKKKEEVKMAY